MVVVKELLIKNSTAVNIRDSVWRKDWVFITTNLIYKL